MAPQDPGTAIVLFLTPESPSAGRRAQTRPLRACHGPLPIAPLSLYSFRIRGGREGGMLELGRLAVAETSGKRRMWSRQRGCRHLPRPPPGRVGIFDSSAFRCWVGQVCVYGLHLAVCSVHLLTPFGLRIPLQGEGGLKTRRGNRRGIKIDGAQCDEKAWAGAGYSGFPFFSKELSSAQLYLQC